MGLKRKSTIIFIALSFILAAACYYYFGIYHFVRDVHVASDYIGLPTAESLFTHAELIVIGSPTKDFEEREVHVSKFSNEVIQDIYTLTDIRVETVIKGPEADAANLKVVEPIGVYQTFGGKKRVAYEGYTEMKKGSQYLIF